MARIFKTSIEYKEYLKMSRLKKEKKAICGGGVQLDRVQQVAFYK